MLAFGRIDPEKNLLNLTFNSGNLLNIVALDIDEAEQFFKKMLQEIYTYKLNSIDNIGYYNNDNEIT